MKNFSTRFLCLTALVFLCGAGALSAANPTPSAKVLSVEGTASAYENGKMVGPLNQGNILEQGTSISTAALSSVDLVFSNGSMLTVEENTSLTLAELQQQAYSGSATYEALQADPSQSQTLLELNYGKVSGEVKGLRPNSKFHIETPLGTAAIRGTIFSVEIRYSAERGEFILIIRKTSGDLAVISRYLGQFDFGQGNVGDKGYDSSLSNETSEDIPDGHIVYIRLSENDPFFPELIDRLRNVLPFQNLFDFPPIGPEDPKGPKGPPRPEFTPDDPGTQVVSPEGPENGNPSAEAE